MPELTSLDLHRDVYYDSHSGSSFKNPIAQEIKEICTLCPQLENFGVDVTQLGSRGKWPMDIIHELSILPKPLVLTIYIHGENAWQARAWDWTVDPWPIARRIRRIRERSGLPWTGRFAVRFQLKGPRSRGHLSYMRRTKNVDTFLSGFTVVYYHKPPPRVDIDQLDIEELENKRAEQSSLKFGWDRKGYGKEIERRKRDANIVLTDTDHLTLYDA
jgi:hypothetical protein